MQFESIKETRQLNTYELRKMAIAKQEADQLLEKRTDYFQSLYEDIQIPHFSIDPIDRGFLGTGTEKQALHIIDMKNDYDRRIMWYQEEYRTWLGYLQEFSAEDADMLIRYFEKGESIPEHTVDRLLTRASELHESYQEANGKARDFEAYEIYQDYLKQLRRKPLKPSIKILQNGTLMEA